MKTLKLKLANDDLKEIFPFLDTLDVSVCKQVSKDWNRSLNGNEINKRSKKNSSSFIESYNVPVHAAAYKGHLELLKLVYPKK